MKSVKEKLEEIKVFFEQEKESSVRSPEVQKTIRKIESGFKQVKGKWVKDPKARPQEDPGPPAQQKPF